MAEVIGRGESVLICGRLTCLEVRRSVVEARSLVLPRGAVESIILGCESVLLGQATVSESWIEWLQVVHRRNVAKLRFVPIKDLVWRRNL